MKIVEDTFEVTGIEQRKESFGVVVSSFVLVSKKERQIDVQLTDEPLRVRLFDKYKVTIELLERLGE